LRNKGEIGAEVWNLGVLLGPEQWTTWLTGSADEAETLIAPPPEDALRAHRVTKKVNNPGYQEEDLLESLGDAASSAEGFA